jgi:Transposase C of IS166 homeodomain
MLDASEPLQNPVLLQARLAAVTSMLEAQNSAVKRLRGERDTLRVERDAFRAARDTASAEVEKLQLIIKQLVRSRYGAHSEKLDPDQLQLGLEEVEQSLAPRRQGSTVSRQPTRKRPASASRRSATAVHCRHICRGSRSSSMSKTSAARAAAARCM